MFQRVGHSAFKKDLTNTRLLCNHLGNPQNKFLSIHIAGTNGKGSTVHTIAAVLQIAGYKTGLYTSPHIKSFTERIKINGSPIGEQQVIDFVAHNKEIIEQIQPSFFEMTVAMAFNEFERQKVEIAIIEVGMGGRFDSTNIINPQLSVITNISYDHQAFLGNTLQEIAFEKAGIIKPNCPVIISERQQVVENVFINKALEVNAPIYFAEDSYKIQQFPTEKGLLFDVWRNGALLFSGVNYQLGGNYQLKNIPGILKAIELIENLGFKIKKDHLLEGFRNVKILTGLKGRWEILSLDPLTICDTAHNEDGIKEVLNQIKAINYNQLHIVFGIVKDKDPEKILQLLPLDARYYFTQAAIPRAMNAEDLKKSAENFNLEGEVVYNINDAINSARINASKDDLIFIGGSIFVVAEIEGL